MYVGGSGLFKNFLSGARSGIPFFGSNNCSGG
jgi:hypothetical protein